MKIIKGTVLYLKFYALLKHTPLHMNPAMDCHTHITQELYNRPSHTHVSIHLSRISHQILK